MYPLYCNELISTIIMPSRIVCEESLTNDFDSTPSGGPQQPRDADASADLLSRIRELGMLPHEVLSEPDQLARLQEVFAALDPALHDQIMRRTDQHIDQKQSRIRAFAEHYDLTAAELDLLTNLCSGLNTRQHAQVRNISKHTVRTHMQRLREKTGAKREAEVIWMVLESNRPKFE